MSFLNLDKKHVVVFGFSNKKSVAYHIAKKLVDEGVQVTHVVHSQKSEELAQKLFPKSNIYICDVEYDDQIKAVAGQVKAHGRAVDGVVHSIAFANYSEGPKSFHETLKKDFLQSVDISCFSLMAIANHFKPLFTNGASVVAISISTTQMASENYGYMAPVKAALDSTICFLAKSFSSFSNVRFNTVNAGLLKTKSSAGIPNYVNSYLFAEECTLRKEALKTEEVANAAVFLISPASAGMNATGMLLDAGMRVNYFDANIVNKATRIEN